MYYRLSSRSAFTLIELLVVIAIIAILSVVVILTLNPAELLKQSRDANRVSDMDTLTHALGIYSSDVSTGNLGSANTIYISIPDPTATSTAGDQCQGLGLPSLPATYTYHCAATSTNRNIDGTGWIPVNFKTISSGSPIGNLPVDPANNSSSRLYYSYATDGTTYEVATAMESQKYKPGGSGDVALGDGGTKAFVYEKGTNLALEPLDYGDSSLGGYWTMDEGVGSTTYDYSGSNAPGTWNGTPAGTNGYYSSGKVGPWAGTFNGTNDYIESASINTPQSALTGLAWINMSVAPVSGAQGFIQSFAVAGGAFNGLNVNGTTGKLAYMFSSGGIVDSSYTVPTSSWHFVGYTLSGMIPNATTSPSTLITMYVDGNAVGITTQTVAVNGKIRVGARSDLLGNRFFNGFIDDVRIYNRALSAAEIQAIYNGGK